jgi:hypothetical protein
VTESILNQAQWTAKLIAEYENDSKSWPGVEYIWWQNPTNPISLRLTTVGYKWISKNTKTVFHKANLIQTLTAKHLLQLERLFKSPYYIYGRTKIYLTNETDYIMLQLHSENLADYLDNLDNQS